MDSQLPDLGEAPVCHLSPPVYGCLLEQPRQTKTIRQEMGSGKFYPMTLVLDSPTTIMYQSV